MCPSYLLENDEFKKQLQLLNTSLPSLLWYHFHVVYSMYVLKNSLAPDYVRELVEVLITVAYRIQVFIIQPRMSKIINTD